MGNVSVSLLFVLCFVVFVCGTCRHGSVIMVFASCGGFSGRRFVVLFRVSFVRWLYYMVMFWTFVLVIVLFMVFADSGCAPSVLSLIFFIFVNAVSQSWFFSGNANLKTQ